MPRAIRKQADLPPLLVDVVKAARHAAERGATASRHGEANALTELGRVARLAAPARGVLAPQDDDLCQEIHRIARLHLGYGRASRRLRAGLRRAGRYEDRDAIETAHAEVVSVTSVAYYYAGLAFGLTFQDLSRK